jgi:CheY-like chemotaxis protein
LWRRPHSTAGPAAGSTALPFASEADVMMPIPSAGTMSMYKIAVCEEDLLIRKLITLVLDTGPWELHFAADTDAGLRCIEQERPDLIFIDVSRPQFNGLQLWQSVKARPDLAHIPVILMINSLQRYLIDPIVQQGEADYLLKPYIATDLRRKVEAVLLGAPSVADEDLYPGWTGGGGNL